MLFDENAFVTLFCSNNFNSPLLTVSLYLSRSGKRLPPAVIEYVETYARRSLLTAFYLRYSITVSQIVEFLLRRSTVFPVWYWSVYMTLQHVAPHVLSVLVFFQHLQLSTGTV